MTRKRAAESREIPQRSRFLFAGRERFARLLANYPVPPARVLSYSDRPNTARPVLVVCQLIARGGLARCHE